MSIERASLERVAPFSRAELYQWATAFLRSDPTSRPSDVGSALGATERAYSPGLLRSAFALAERNVSRSRQPVTQRPPTPLPASAYESFPGNQRDAFRIQVEFTFTDPRSGTKYTRSRSLVSNRSRSMDEWLDEAAEAGVDMEKSYDWELDDFAFVAMWRR